jgi:hypothetical protein
MTKARALKRVAAFGGIALFVASSTWAAACVDLTPVTPGEVVTIPIPIPDVQQPPRRDASPSTDGDAGPGDAGFDVYLPPCLACLLAPDTPGPGCATEVAACMADPQCGAAYACAIENNCFLVQTREAILICSTPCVTEAGGITSSTSTSGMLVANVAACLTNPPPGCGSVCAPTD